MSAARKMTPDSPPAVEVSMVRCPGGHDLLDGLEHTLRSSEAAQHLLGGWYYCRLCVESPVPGAPGAFRIFPSESANLFDLVEAMEGIGHPTWCAGVLKSIRDLDVIPGSPEDLLPLLTHENPKIRAAALALIPKLKGEDDG